METIESHLRLPNRTSSLLNSPILARVERARLRNEFTSKQHHPKEENPTKRILDPNQYVIPEKLPIHSLTGPIKRGILWQQRDRIFSRWKERYFILTRDYLHCFKKATASERISDMGQFIFKVKLVDVEKVEWINRRSYSAISIFLGNRDGRILLRCDNCLEDWFELLEECTSSSKERRRALRTIQGPRSRASLAALPSHHSSLLPGNQINLGATYSSAFEDCFLMHKKLPGNPIINFPLSDSVPDLTNFNSMGSSTNLYNNIARYSVNSSILPIGTNERICNSTARIHCKNGTMDYDHSVEKNCNRKNDWIFRKPIAENDIDDCLETQPSAYHRPSSFSSMAYSNSNSLAKNTDHKMSASHETLYVVSPPSNCSTRRTTNGLRHNIQKASNLMNYNDAYYDSNQNQHYKTNENSKEEPKHSTANNIEKYYDEHVVLRNKMHDAAQRINYRDRSFSDNQPPPSQIPRRPFNANLPISGCRPYLGTVTNV